MFQWSSFRTNIMGFNIRKTLKSQSVFLLVQFRLFFEEKTNNYSLFWKLKLKFIKSSSFWNCLVINSFISQKIIELLTRLAPLDKSTCSNELRQNTEQLSNLLDRVIYLNEMRWSTLDRREREGEGRGAGREDDSQTLVLRTWTEIIFFDRGG